MSVVSSLRVLVPMIVDDLHKCETPANIHTYLQFMDFDFLILTKKKQHQFTVITPCFRTLKMNYFGKK